MTVQNEQPAIPKAILENMVAECKGDREKILNNALKYVAEKNDEIRISIWMARKGYLKQNGEFSELEQDNADALIKINEIIDANKKLKALLPSTSAIAEENDNATALERLFHVYMWEANLNEEDFGVSETEKKLSAYGDFISLLEYQSLIFEEVKKSLSLLKRGKGRPRTASKLEGFIEQIAHLYQAATGKKFTANEYGDKDYDSEGMRFAEKALPVLYTPDSGTYENFEENTGHTPYTYENFRNACDYVVKLLGNNKAKTP